MVNLRERAVGALWSWTGKTRDAVRAGAQGEEEASPGRPHHLAALAGKQLRARTHARGGCAGQGAGDPHRITVATPILSFLSLCKFRPKFELKPNFHQNESCAKIYKLQIII